MRKAKVNIDSFGEGFHSGSGGRGGVFIGNKVCKEEGKTEATKKREKRKKERLEGRNIQDRLGRQPVPGQLARGEKFPLTGEATYTSEVSHISQRCSPNIHLPVRL